MEYQEEFVIDFVRRTRKNLEFIEDRVEADPGAELFEVTQLVNSLLGIIVLPREYYIKSIPEIPPTLLLFDVIENNLHVS